MFVYKGPEGIVQVGGVPGKGAPVRRLGRDVAIWRDGGGLSPTPSPTRSHWPAGGPGFRPGSSHAKRHDDDSDSDSDDHHDDRTQDGRLNLQSLVLET